MNFVDAVKSCFSKYVTFSGRAMRSEYWFFVLFIFLGAIVLTIIDVSLFGGAVDPATGMRSSGPLVMIFQLAILLPAISVAVRRLHDLDKSGWWYWIGLIPLVGAIILLVWFCTKGTQGANRFGA